MLGRLWIANQFKQMTGKRTTIERPKTRLLFDVLDAYGITNEDVVEVMQNKYKDGMTLNDLLAKELYDSKVNQRNAQTSLGMVEQALASVMVNQYAPTLAEAVKGQIDDYIKNTYGAITRKVELEIPQTGGRVKGITHEKFDTVLKFVAADEPVLLVGPAGSGKNVICQQVAKALNTEFYFSNAITQEYKLTGFIDANGTYHETQFYKAFKDGGVFMLDEMDASIPEVLVILNAAITNRYFDFPVGKVQAHPDFRIVAAANTFGTGASYIYTGRNQLDGASLDRFATIYIGYSKQIEQSITKDEELLDFTRRFRKACEENGISHIVSYRSLSRLDKLKDLIPIDELLRDCLIKNLEKDDINMMAGAFAEPDDRWSKAFRKIVREGTR